MSTLSSHILGCSDRQSFTSLEYHEAEGATMPLPEELAEPVEESKEPILTLTERELSERLLRATDLAKVEAEKRVRQEYDQQLSKERQKILSTVEGFLQERSEYYSAVEAELVQLSLAIAGKILHREAQVDRMLLAGLVKVAIENLQHRSNVVVRVRPEQCELWREYFSRQLPTTKVEILEDSQLQEQDCKLETELGTADVGIDAQLKEVERGFFDLLAQRPEIR